MNSFYRKMKPYVEAQIDASNTQVAGGQPSVAFENLERAHVLGQEATILHTRVHWAMLVWGIRQRDLKEVLGQLFRLVGAATKTAVGLVPHGNTGGANVSPFAVMPIPSYLARVIAEAKRR